MTQRDELLHGEITEQIIGAFWDVGRELGYGFLESVYRRAMVVALGARGVSCVQERLFTVQFKGQDVGNYRADLVVSDKVIVEIKSGPERVAAHEAQLYNYLKASQLHVGLLMNFGPKLQYSRHILTQNHQRP
jgi:GxxExxY protein